MNQSSNILGSSGEGKALGEFHVKARVRTFPMQNLWVYVPVPSEHSEALKPFRLGFFTPIRVVLGKSCWDTSLAPIGKGNPDYTHSILLPFSIREAENIKLGDIVSLTYGYRKI